MIIRSLCNTCFQTFELRFNMGDDRLLAQITDGQSNLCPCPRHCGGKINVANDPGMDTMRQGMALRPSLVLTAQELYAATFGMPLPDEVPKDRLVLLALLKGAQVKDVVVEEHADRFYLHEIVLMNGLVVHLAAGGHGAQVLKITKEL